MLAALETAHKDPSHLINSYLQLHERPATDWHISVYHSMNTLNILCERIAFVLILNINSPSNSPSSFSALQIIYSVFYLRVLSPRLC